MKKNHLIVLVIHLVFLAFIWLKWKLLVIYGQEIVTESTSTGDALLSARSIINITIVLACAGLTVIGLIWLKNRDLIKYALITFAILVVITTFLFLIKELEAARIIKDYVLQTPFVFLMLYASRKLREAI